jgi:hypothetical protein
VNFEPTDFAPGSPEKLDLIFRRYDASLPLWHPDDRNDYNGMRGGVHVTTRKRQEARPGKQIIKLATSGRKMRAE